MTRRESFRSARVALCAMLLAGACGGGGVSETGTGPGPTPPVDTTKPPTVQRASITARVSIDPADATLATTAGVGVSGLTVRLTSSRASDPVRTATTGADGSARFDDLLEGVYTASVDRPLTAGEVARLAPADREASMFAGGGQVVLTPPTARSMDVALVGARRGSVVISEIFANYGPLVFTGFNYVYGSYVELYNNSDTTAWLDGMLLALTPGWHGESSTGSCTGEVKRLRLDSTSIYSSIILGIPGSGRDYPILPGEAKVVAMDALNHQAAAPEKEQVDLSGAHFEQFFTDADIDNPFAVNVTRFYGQTAGVFGRGMGYFSGALQHVLLSRDARASFVEATFTTTGASGPVTWQIGKLPSAHVLDLVALEYSPQSFGYENNPPRCTPWTAPAFDRAPAPLVHGHQRKAIARRGLGRTTAGHEIVQRTKNSERDFVWAEPLRRSLNK